jgi:hypothetical protein
MSSTASDATTTSGDRHKSLAELWAEDDAYGLAKDRERAVQIITGPDSEEILVDAPKDGIYSYYFYAYFYRCSVRLEGDDTRGYMIKKWFWVGREQAELPSEFTQYVWKVTGVWSTKSLLERHPVQEDSETATKKRTAEAVPDADAGLAEEPVKKKARRATIYDADWDSEENQAERAKREAKRVAKYLEIALYHLNGFEGLHTLEQDCINIPIKNERRLQLVFRRCDIAVGTKDLRFESWAIDNLGGYFKDLPAELAGMRFEVLSLDRENQTAELKLQ